MKTPEIWQMRSTDNLGAESAFFECKSLKIAFSHIILSIERICHFSRGTYAQIFIFPSKKRSIQHFQPIKTKNPRHQKSRPPPSPHHQTSQNRRNVIIVKKNSIPERNYLLIWKKPDTRHYSWINPLGGPLEMANRKRERIRRDNGRIRTMIGRSLAENLIFF